MREVSADELARINEYLHDVLKALAKLNIDGVFVLDAKTEIYVVVLPDYTLSTPELLLRAHDGACEYNAKKAN